MKKPKKKPTSKSLALQACDVLVDAYKDGLESGGSIDWSWIDMAHALAKKALRAEKMGKKK